jgi:hypothetical protein
MMTTDPHHAEYLAAVAGMAETYGTPSVGHGAIHAGRVITKFAAGDWVTARLPDGSTRQVCVIEVLTDDGEDSEYHVACHIPGKGRQHYAVKNRDIRIF